MIVVPRNLLSAALALAVALGTTAWAPKVSIASPAPVSISAVQGAFYSNPSNSGSLNLTNLVTPVFTQSFPVIDFNPPAVAQVNCSNSTGIDENSRPFTDVVPQPDGTCYTDPAQGQFGLTVEQAGVTDLSMFQAIFTAYLTVAAQGQVTFYFYSDDGWMLGAGQRQGGTEQPSFVSGSMVNPLSITPGKNYPVIGSYNIPSAPAQNQVVVNIPAAGTYPIEVDYTECCSGQLALVLGTTFGNPVPGSNPSTGIAPTILDGTTALAQGPVASIGDAAAAASAYRVHVDWGDGTSAFLSTISPSPDGTHLDAIARHSYKAPGIYQAIVGIFKSGAFVGSVTSFAVITAVNCVLGPAPPLPAQGHGSGTAQDLARRVIANFNLFTSDSFYQFITNVKSEMQELASRSADQTFTVQFFQALGPRNTVQLERLFGQVSPQMGQPEAYSALYQPLDDALGTASHQFGSSQLGSFAQVMASSPNDLANFLAAGSYTDEAIGTFNDVLLTSRLFFVSYVPLAFPAIIRPDVGNGDPWILPLDVLACHPAAAALFLKSNHQAVMNLLSRTSWGDSSIVGRVVAAGVLDGGGADPRTAWSAINLDGSGIHLAPNRDPLLKDVFLRTMVDDPNLRGQIAPDQPDPNGLNAFQRVEAYVESNADGHIETTPVSAVLLFDNLESARLLTTVPVNVNDPNFLSDINAWVDATGKVFGLSSLPLLRDSGCSAANSSSLISNENLLIAALSLFVGSNPIGIAASVVGGLIVPIADQMLSANLQVRVGQAVMAGEAAIMIQVLASGVGGLYSVGLIPTLPAGRQLTDYLTQIANATVLADVEQDLYGTTTGLTQAQVQLAQNILFSVDRLALQMFRQWPFSLLNQQCN